MKTYFEVGDSTFSTEFNIETQIGELGFVAEVPIANNLGRARGLAQDLADKYPNDEEVKALIKALNYQGYITIIKEMEDEEL